MKPKSFSVIIYINFGLLSLTNAVAQGGFNFHNIPASAVVDSTTGSPAGQSLFLVGLYFSPNPSSVPNLNQAMDDFLLASVTPVLAGGIYNGGIVSSPGLPPGTEVVLQVRGWSSSFASFAEAWSDPSGQALVGGSNLMGPFTLDGSVVDLAMFVEGFALTPVPEPSTALWGIVASVALVLARVRPPRSRRYQP